MFKTNKNNDLKIPVLQALALSLLGIFAFSLPSYAQSGSSPSLSSGNSIYGFPGTTAIRDPLVPGASFSLPGVPAATGAIPPIGSGAVPLPPNPGMLSSPPTLIPWTNNTTNDLLTLPTNQVSAPANQINLPTSQISLPASNALALPPGAMNALVGGSIPHSPSTPGPNLGMLRSSNMFSGANGLGVAGYGFVNPVGQINGYAPIIRSIPRQYSADFGLPRAANAYRLITAGPTGPGAWVPLPGSSTVDSGRGAKGGVVPAQISFDSPMAAQYPGQAISGVPAQNSAGNHAGNFANAQVTNDLYGIPMINPNKITTSSSGAVSQGPPAPLTTIIPPPTI